MQLDYRDDIQPAPLASPNLMLHLLNRPKALVIGASGFIGKGLADYLWNHGFEVTGPRREALDLLNLPDQLPWAHVWYICAAMSRFIECEDQRAAYRVNVDGPVEIGRRSNINKYVPRVVYLSSEAVERALHTNYGMHKALAEMGLRAVCSPIIVRLSKVTPERLKDCCAYLASLAEAEPGVYHWP